jgi:phosphohistidine phosphatase
MEMSRYLLLLRHAKSDWGSDAPEDFERPLARRGKKDTRRMGRWMQLEGLSPDYVVSSPAVRARETVYGVCEELGIQIDDIHFDRRIYEADATSLLTVLADCPQGPNTILLVGHNPGLADLLAWLWGEKITVPEDGKLLPTATLARLRMPKDWTRLERGCARMVVLTRPRSLPAEIDGK